MSNRLLPYLIKGKLNSYIFIYDAHTIVIPWSSLLSCHFPILIHVSKHDDVTLTGEAMQPRTHLRTPPTIKSSCAALLETC